MKKLKEKRKKEKKFSCGQTLAQKPWTYFGIAHSTFTTSAMLLLIWDFFNTLYVFMMYVSSENDSFDSLTHNSSRICAY